MGHPTQGSSLNHQLLGRVRIVETFDPETHRKVPLRVLGIVSVTGVLLQDFVHHEPIQVPSIVGSQPIAPHRSVDVGEQFELLSSTHHGVNHPGQQVPIQSIQGWRALQRLLELPGHHQLLGFEPGTCMSFTFDPCHVHPRYEPDSSPQEWTHSHRGGFNLHICRPPIRNKQYHPKFWSKPQAVHGGGYRREEEVHERSNAFGVQSIESWPIRNRYPPSHTLGSIPSEHGAFALGKAAQSCATHREANRWGSRIYGELVSSSHVVPKPQSLSFALTAHSP